ncbi:MAG TPA: M13 family metallopeptidase N-terminal domain-containing protein, partial [Holophaga sp.]|nr:M13 family metallopeptidase N-terminal domain-containing protein [Holophaga sp.]
MRMLRIALALPCVAVALAAQSPAQQAPATGVNPAYLDRAQAPCKDLYGFSNGTFDATPIPAAYASYGVNEEINERNEAILKQILEDALSAKDAPAGSVSARLRDFYASGMDTAEIEASGLKPIEPILHEIQALKSRKDLAPLLARLQAQGINAGPAFGVGQDDKNSKAIVAKLYQGGLGLPEREFYFRKDGKTREQRQAYVQHVARMFELAGDPADKAQKAAQRLLVFETKLAKVSRKLVDLRDPQANYHKMERRTLDKMAPGFGWPLYFRTLGLPDGEKRLVVGQPEFLQGFARLTGTAPLEDVKTYLRWHLLNATAEYLGKDLESADFDFYGKTLRGRKEMFPRWKRVLFAVDRGIGEDLGQAFVKRAFSPEAKAKVLEMVRFHREALKLSLQRAPWMSDATKTQALHKLET